MRHFALMCLLVVGCHVESVEAGRIEFVDVGRIMSVDGEELVPSYLPWYVVHADDVNDDLVDEAANWWNMAFGEELFVVDHACWWDYYRYGLDTRYRYGVIMVWQAPPRDERVLGIADLYYDDGDIEAVNIKMSTRCATDNWFITSLRHQFGHALGLGDDPGGLDSIMSGDELVLDAVVTEYDRELIEEEL